MADRYWVGGSGTWNATSTTNWSASSGGGSGASAPTSADNVIFNSASNATLYTVTVGTDAVCADMTVAGPASGNVTFSLGATAVINCYGSFTLPATGATWTAIAGSAVNFLATTTGKTITTNGISLGSGIVTFDGIGGGWTLGSALTLSAIALTNGSFNTGNYNITGTTFSSNNSNTRTLTLGSSTYTLSGAAAWNTTTTTGLTFTPGTSQITCSNASPTFQGGGLTFYNVSFTNTTAGTTTITGANTFNNLTQSSRNTTGARPINIGADQTVSGTLTLGAANTSIRRLFVQSDTIGTQRTITLNGSLATLADCDFRDIATAGSVGTWTGTRLGNGLNNSGITFDAPKDVYWNYVTGAFSWPSSNWALSSGGATSANNLPLAQDKIIIEDTGLASGGTISFSSANYWIGELDISNRTLPMTLNNGTINGIVYKNVTLSSAVTMTGTVSWNFHGQGTTQILDTNTATFVPPFAIESPGGTLQLAENTTCSATVTLTQGTLDLNNNVLTANAFSSSNSNTRVIAFGTGNITLTGNAATIWTTATATNFSYTGTPTVNCTYSGSVGTRTIGPGNFTLSTESTVLNFNISAGTDIVTTTTNHAFKSLNFTGFAGTLTSSNRVLYGNLTLGAGMTSTDGTGVTTFASTLVQQNITSNGVVLGGPITCSGTQTVQLQENLTIGSTRTFTLTSGTLDLSSGNRTLSTGIFSSSNSNTRAITFGTGNITLTGNAATIFNTTSAANLTITGTPTVNATYSGSTGTRTFTAGVATGTQVNLNVSAGSDIFTSGGGSNFNNLNFTGFSGTLGNANRNIYSNIIFSSGMTCSPGALVLNFLGTSGTQQITTNGILLDFPIVQINSGATLQLQDNLTIGSTRTFTLTEGSLDLSNRNLTCGFFSSNNSNVRAMTSGTGVVNVTGNSGTVWVFVSTNATMNDRGTINATYAGSTGTRTFNGGQFAESLTPNLNITAGSDTFTMSSATRSNNLNFTGFSGFLTTVGTSVYGNLTLSSSMTIASQAANIIFRATTGTRTITTNGVTSGLAYVFSGDGAGTAGTWAFQDAVTQNSLNAFTIQAGTVQLKASTTNTVNAFVTNGTFTKALQSTIPGTQATISQASGDVYADYITITDSNATGGANFYATAASNGGNNTGWNFATNFYYWVGGDGNWSDAANHWSNASGGSPSASYLPTAADIVIFDANSNSGTSAFNVTVDGTSGSPSLCNDFVCGTGLGGGALDGAMTLLSPLPASQLNCYGSLSVPASNFSFSAPNQSFIYFKSTSAVKTITTNGIVMSNWVPVFDGVGGSWALGSAIIGSGAIQLLNGTLTTNNYSVSFANLQSSNANVRTLNLGSSSVTLTGSIGWSCLDSTNMTLNAGTSTITCSAASPTFAGGGLTYYNVSFTSASNGISTISGANTFNTLFQTSRSATGRRAVVLTDNQTINGTLYLGTANTAIRRVFLTSNIVGTARTVTVNGSFFILTDVDFRDITAAGTAGTWSGSRLGDCLGNTNITFVAGKNVYRVGTGNWSDTQWALTSGGAVNVNYFPLAQDIMIFDTNTLTGTNTIDNPWQFGGLDCSALNVAVTIDNGTQGPSFYKNIILDADITTTGTGQWFFVAQGITQQLTSAGVTLAPAITVESATGTLQLQDNATTLLTTTLNSGSIDLNNNVLSTGLFNSNNTNTRSIAFGTGNITITATNGTVFNMDTATNFTLTGTPVVNVSSNELPASNKTIDIGNAAPSTSPETNAISVNILGGTQGVNVYGSQFKNLDFTGFSGQWNELGSIGIYGNLTLSSTMTFPVGTNPLTYIIFSKTTGTQTATFNGVTVDRPILVAAPGGIVAFQDTFTQTLGRTFDFNTGTLQLKSGTTNTVGVFATNGATLKYLQATTPGSQATITTADTTPVFATYLNVKDSFAAQVDFWHALFTDNNQNGGNNTNWIFNSSNNNFFMMFA